VPKILKILIVGENSYIGRSFRDFAGGRYEITAVSSRGGAWADADFAACDAILHCAGLAHVKQGAGMERLYYEVNCDLAAGVARKAASEGARQLIFLSSMAVYGGTGKTEITKDTPPEAARGDFYGGSKLKAERELGAAVSGGPVKLKLCIVRPPMVYGSGCKGNFKRLVSLARAAPVFPDFANKRSMIYIDNLCAFICGLIDREAEGVFLPQNREYVSTAELVRLIAAHSGRRMAATRLFNPLLRPLAKRGGVFGKLFGDLAYAGEGVDYIGHVGFEESVKRSLV